tara:strand:+ start:1465 stop:1884 length:420 start_codon:yes stop_codon:yes gene_type:complete
MNVLDLEIFDQAANNLQQSLKQLDKFYPNEKSLANYLEAMSEVPPEEWKRFEPIKGEGEREALRNVSHFAGLMVSIAANLYSQYLELSGSIYEILEENDKQQKEIERLKSQLKFINNAMAENFQMEKEIIEILMPKIMA